MSEGSDNLAADTVRRMTTSQQNGWTMTLQPAQQTALLAERDGLRTLVQDRIEAHREYDGCDTDPCDWCRRAVALVGP